MNENIDGNPDFSKMSYSEIATYVDAEAKRRLQNQTSKGNTS